MFTAPPSAILVTLGPVTIRWYGVCLAAAVAAGVWVVYHQWRRQGWPSEQFDSLTFWLIVGGLLGARLYAVGLFWRYYAAHPGEILAIWHGGLAIHGALIGGGLASAWWARRHRRSWRELVDVVVLALPLGQAIGRWGNYFNQELFGWPTSQWWGIPIDLAHRPAAFRAATHFQPTFLFESVANLVFFGVLVGIQRTVRRSKQPWPAGTLGLVYLIGYAVIRFSLEFVRIDQTPTLWGWRWPQIISIMIGAGAIAILGCWWRRRGKQRN